MPAKFDFKKSYQDRDYLVNEYVTLGRSSKDIGKNLHVSYKLVEIWLRHYDLPIREQI